MKKITALMVLGIMLTGLTASAQLDVATFKARIAAIRVEIDALSAELSRTPEEQKAYELRLAAMTGEEQVKAIAAECLIRSKISRCFYRACLLSAEQNNKPKNAEACKAMLARLEIIIARWQRQVETGKWEQLKLPPPVNK